MAARIEPYVDTSAFIALLDRSDTHHPLFGRLFSNPPRLITTSLVVAEGHGWFLRRYDRTRALQFLAMLDAMTPLRVLAVGAQQIASSAELLRDYQDQDLTLTDAVGLWFMAERKTRSCWSTDRHLGLNGVPLIVHEH